MSDLLLPDDQPDPLDLRLERLIDELLEFSYRFAYRLTGNDADAGDASQAGLLSFVQNYEPSQFASRSQVRCYLSTIVRNKVRDQHRRRSCAGRHLQTYAYEMHLAAETPPVEAAEKTETVDLVQEAVDGLPETHSAVVLMYYVDGLSLKEIADLLEVPEGTVKSRLSEARKKLKKLLDPDVWT